MPLSVNRSVLSHNNAKQCSDLIQLSCIHKVFMYVAKKERLIVLLIYLLELWIDSQ